MKTLRLTTFIPFILISIFNCSAIDLERFGVRTAMELTIPGKSGIEAYQTGAGFTVGAIYSIPIYGKISFEPGLMLFYTTMTAQQDFQINGFLYQDTARNIGLRIPLMFNYNIAVSPLLDLIIGTGPWFNFSVYAHENILPNMTAPEHVPSTRINLFNHGWNHFDAAWGFNLCVTFAKSYFMGITASAAFTPLASFGNHNKTIKVYRNTIAFSLGYNF